MAEIELVTREGNRSGSILSGFKIPKTVLKYGVPIGLTVLGGYLVLKNLPSISSFFAKGLSVLGSDLGQGLSGIGVSIQKAYTDALNQALQYKQSGVTQVNGADASIHPSIGNPLGDTSSNVPSGTISGASSVIVNPDGTTTITQGEGGGVTTADALAAIEKLIANPINESGNQQLINAENTLYANLSPQDQSIVLGQQSVGLFKLPDGSILPLSQNAVDYYKSVGVKIYQV